MMCVPRFADRKAVVLGLGSTNVPVPRPSPAPPRRLMAASACQKNTEKFWREPTNKREVWAMLGSLNEVL